MSIVPKTNPFNLESLFGDSFPSFRLLPESRSETGMLAVDITEDDKAYTVTADFPGLTKEEIDINLENSILTISAEHRESAEKKEKGRVIRKERRYGKYSRSFSLGDNADESAVEAHFENGVLNVVIPKTASHKGKQTRIAIK